MAHAIGLKDSEFALNRGFYSNSNARELLLKGHHFTLGVLRNENNTSESLAGFLSLAGVWVLSGCPLDGVEGTAADTVGRAPAPCPPRDWLDYGLADATAAIRSNGSLAAGARRDRQARLPRWELDVTADGPARGDWSWSRRRRAP
jgi:hypothetical protein